MIAAQGEEESGSGDHKAGADPQFVKARSQFPASFMRKSVKAPVSTVIARDRLPEVIAPVWVFRFRSLLRLKSSSPEVVIEDCRCDFISDDCLNGGPANV